MTHSPSLNANPVRLRHIVRVGLPVTPDPHEHGVSGTDVTVLGEAFRGSWGGLGGDRGYQTGEYERRMYEEGDFRLRLANGPGEDGRLHRDRFAITNGDVPDSRPGDEWIEVYDGIPGRLVFVAVPLDFEQKRGTLELQGSDALWTLKKAREFEAGFWCNAPRDVFEHYTRVWKAEVADDFGSFNQAWDGDANFSTSDDGRWQYLRAGTSSLPTGVAFPPAGRVRLCTDTTGSTGEAKIFADDVSFPVGPDSSDPHGAWRCEWRFWRSTFAASTNVKCGIETDEAVPVNVAQFLMTETETQHFTSMMAASDKDGFNTARPGPFYVTIEGRDRWVFFYLNGRMTAVAPMPEVAVGCRPYFRLSTSSGDGSAADRWADLDSMVVRTCKPYLMRDTDKGDLHLGTAADDLESGGLQATFYDDHDLVPMAAANRPHHMLNPVKPPYRRKLEDTLDFPASGWQPAGPANSSRWSVRFAGAIFLDLEASDIALGLNSSLAKRKRLWVGKTRVGEQLIDTWATAVSGRQSSGGLRAHLGTITGWYPIIVEYSTDTANTSTFLLEQDVNVDGSWTVVPATQLSPFGLVIGHVRGESHFDQLRAIAESFGLQYRCDPRQLESGFFPGHVAPKVRVGRDTAKVVDRIEADDYGKTGSIREVADTIFGDGSGLADAESAAQLTVEAIDYDTLEDRLFVQTQYEQAADLDYEPMLARRLDVLLALRRNVWEEVGAVPKGARELLDRFPLEDDMELFSWEPGDGVRLMIPEVGIMDTAPRQILGVRRAFRPDGVMRPIVSFRPRPRGFLTLLRDLKLGTLRTKRRYQGQLVALTGSVAARNDLNIVITGSRCAFPTGEAQLVKATAVVLTAVTGTWRFQVNGVDALTGITEPGRYDVTPWAAKGTDEQEVILQAFDGDSTIIRYQLELLVTV